MLDDELQRRWVVAEAEARLFGGARAPVQVGRFELRDRLGSGGFGVVYLAFDRDLDREVALKLGRADRSAGAARDRDRMLREARAMARLAHPNVVPVYEVGLHESRVYVAMERVAGTTVRTWLAAARPTWQRIVEIYVQAGRGLAAAHAAGIVHRDVKPDNILVGDDGRARITDFGIDEVAGTPGYIAPEAAASATADQYAFAVALAEALRGHDVPPRITRALDRARADQPADRWPTLTALLDTLATRPERRALRIVLWTLVVLILLAALAGAIMQFVMLRDWMRH